MKYIKIMLFIMMGCAVSIDAARLTVFNATNDIQDVTVHAGGAAIAAARIAPQKSYTFNSWTKPFNMLVWRALIQETGPVRSGQPRYKVSFSANIPSSATMLTGVINLWQNGNYGINFDEHGASEKKVRNLRGF